MKRIALLVVALACFAGPAAAAEESAAARKTDVQEPFKHLASIIELVASGELDSAYEKYAEKLIDSREERGEFESEFRTGFRRLFKQFPKSVDSLDLVAVRTLSTKSFRLTAIANSRQGPIVVEAITYRHQDKWWFCQIAFQPVHLMDAERLRSFSESLPVQRLETPVSISIQSRESAKLSESRP